MLVMTRNLLMAAGGLVAALAFAYGAAGAPFYQSDAQITCDMDAEGRRIPVIALRNLLREAGE